VRFGTEVVQVGHGPRPTVVTTDGETTVDLVISGEGLRSSIRQTLEPQVAFRPSGTRCWRGVTSVVVVDEASEHWGDGVRIGLVPLSSERTYYYWAWPALTDRLIMPLECRCVRRASFSLLRRRPA
jgi:2-polyprenyl-6-methoxyphenol hydroxylase-like FAD-dependent oxidoreductase